MGGNWIGNGKLPLETAVAAHFFLALEAIFAGGPVARLRKSTIFESVEVQADGLSACENMIWPHEKSLFVVVAVTRSSFPPIK